MDRKQDSIDSSKRHLSSTASLPSISQVDLDKLAADAFEKSGAYLKSQLDGTLDEFKLIQNMNQAAAQKYAGMKLTASEVVQSLENLSIKYDNVQPFIDQIDAVVSGTKKLEIAACALDNYVKCLENKVKQLEKR